VAIGRISTRAIGTEEHQTERGDQYHAANCEGERLRRPHATAAARIMPPDTYGLNRTTRLDRLGWDRDVAVSPAVTYRP